MKLYCTALSGEDVSVSGSTTITDKKYRLGESDLATSDGKTIYLPDVIKDITKKKITLIFIRCLHLINKH